MAAKRIIKRTALRGVDCVGGKIRGLAIASLEDMVKLTRMNRQMIAINPDHICWVESTPDTTICLLNGEHHLVRESLDELIDKVIEFRRSIRPDLGCAATLHDIPRARTLRVEVQPEMAVHSHK